MGRVAKASIIHQIFFRDLEDGAKGENRSRSGAKAAGCTITNSKVRSIINYIRSPASYPLPSSQHKPQI
jgi:hypothetical protein